MLYRTEFRCNTDKSEIHKKIFEKINKRNLVRYPKVNDYLLNAVLEFEEISELSLRNNRESINIKEVEMPVETKAVDVPKEEIDGEVKAFLHDLVGDLG